MCLFSCRYIEAWLGKPALIRETSRLSITQALRHPVKVLIVVHYQIALYLYYKINVFGINNGEEGIKLFYRLSKMVVYVANI